MGVMEVLSKKNEEGEGATKVGTREGDENKKRGEEEGEDCGKDVETLNREQCTCK